MKKETKLTKEQRLTLVRMKVAVEDLASAMRFVNYLWMELDQLDVSTGFMNTFYPFKEEFNTEVKNVNEWSEYISSKANEILINDKTKQP